jgi:hypothetical protein
MPTYYGTWEYKPELLGPDLNMQLSLYEAFLAQHKAQVAAGIVKEVHVNLDGVTGYFLTTDISHEKMLMAVQQWLPFVRCEVHQTVKLEQALLNFIEIAKQRIAMMK